MDHSSDTDSTTGLVNQMRSFSTATMIFIVWVDGWMDTEVFPLLMMRSRRGIVWSDEYCSIGSTRPAQHDTTAASVRLTDGTDGSPC